MAATRLEVGANIVKTFSAVSLLAAVGVFFSHSAAWAEDEVTPDGDTVEEVVISEPFFSAPTVLSPLDDELPRVVQGPEGQWFWLLEVTNSDYQPGFSIDDGYVGFETLPSVGIFDTVAERLAWTNHTFACFVAESCEEPARTADQRAFGDDFVRLPKLYDETTGTIAYHVEHAYQVAQEPYEWLVSQETLHLAVPLAETPTGVIDIWVGYTYVYTDDLVGVPVRFTEDAMAITPHSVNVPPVPEQELGELPSEAEEETPGVPLWVIQALLGIVGILAIFGIIALIVNRMVAIMRQNQ